MRAMSRFSSAFSQKSCRSLALDVFLMMTSAMDCTRSLSCSISLRQFQASLFSMSNRLNILTS